LGAILADPDTAPTLYSQDPAAFRTLITADAAAEDVIAVARRRDQLDQFELMMHDKAYFDALAGQAGSKERVWQRFFERNPWIFGCSLTGQLLTSWDPDKLERVVSGGEVGSVEKRIDAFLRTKGAISSIVLAEIKHHRTDLLHAVSAPYRPGCWAVSPELAGAVAQVQGSVSLAVRALGHRLERTEPDGTIDPRDPTFLFQPRAFLVVGSLAEFTDGPGRFNQDKARSFELFRRNLQSPEILTFDELLERARWNVTGAARPR
jgi:hypothetical protein